MPLALPYMASKPKGASRKSKKNRPPAFIQGVLATNVKLLRESVYKGLPHETAQNAALARSADTTTSQIQRIVNGELAIGVDLVERLAMALGVDPAELMTPYFAQKRRAAEQAQQIPFETPSAQKADPDRPDTFRS